MAVTKSVETFCTECGARVVLEYRAEGDVAIEGGKACRVTEKGTVYCECPGCGEPVAAYPPYAPGLGGVAPDVP
jgi:hypothetical protein